MGGGIPVPEYEEYIAYSDGSIFSTKTNIFLKPIIHKNGYASVTLWKNGKGKQFLLHRLIAMIFIPNPDNLTEVDHIDCNTQNNQVSNLRWISRENNINRSYDLQHQTHNRRPVKQIALDGTIVKRYKSQADAYRETHILHIAEVCKHKRKTAGGYQWEYDD